MIVIDDFMADPERLRRHALSREFIDWDGFDGEVYKRVWIGDVPGLEVRIEREMGRVDMLGMGYRLNFNGEKPNAAIHSDMGWGTHALVLYLNDGEGGTAFWRHRETGENRIDPGDVELYEKIKGSWDDESQWEQTDLVGMKMNRAVIYESAYFHSRYPFEAFGSCPEDGRLIAVAFFSPVTT